jgi:hypothetical protein
MDRRNLLQASLAATLGAAITSECAHGKASVVGGFEHEYCPERMLAALIAVQEEQATWWNDSLLPEQIDNLKYAVMKIEPRTHQEMAFVVAIGMSAQPLGYVVDEYVSRRRNGPASMPDHPVLALENWCVPASYRLPIFREQMDCLIMELTDHRMRDTELWHYIRVMKISKISMREFQEQLREPHRSRLTVAETKAIYETVHTFLNVGTRPYTWCSTITERAMQMVLSA